MTQQIAENSACSSNLFLPVPDTNSKELLFNLLKISGKHPKILASIRKDQKMIVLG